MGNTMSVDFELLGNSLGLAMHADRQTACTGGEKCICKHNTCSPGIPMQPHCVEGATHRPACVNRVDSRLENCYKSTWNQDCIDESKATAYLVRRHQPASEARPSRPRFPGP